MSASLQLENNIQEISLNGSASYRIDGQQVVIAIPYLSNNRNNFALTGTLSVELWALTAPYQGGDFSGQALAGTQIGELLDQHCLQNCEYRLNFAVPQAGEWSLCLMLREWNGTAFETRDFINFSLPYLVETKTPVSRSEDGKVIDVDFTGRKAPETDTAEAKVEAKTETKTEAKAEVNKEETVAKTAEPAKAAQPAKAAATKTAEVKADAQSVSINEATLQELEQVKGLNKKLAGVIYNSRPYKKLEDLLNLKGMGPKLLKKIQKYLSI